MNRVLILGTIVPLLGAPVLAADDAPIMVTPEQIREHIIKQHKEIQMRDDAIRELLNTLELRQKQIESLRSKTNCV